MVIKYESLYRFYFRTTLIKKQFIEFKREREIVSLLYIGIGSDKI